VRFYCLPSDSTIVLDRFHIVLKLWRYTTPTLLNKGRQILRQGIGRQQAALLRSRENVHLVLAQSGFYLLVLSSQSSDTLVAGPTPPYRRWQANFPL
jgi:hypothetical protein